MLAALRLSSQPLDDDQLATRTNIHPRQQVNQICRGLYRSGLIRRYVGPDNKIVNELVTPPGDEPTQAAVGPPGAVASTQSATADFGRASDHRAPPGSSMEQRAAERVILDLLGAQISEVLEPARIAVPSGVRVEVDGATADRSVLVECWAHQGAVKSAQRHKVLADAFKLSWIATTIYPRPRLILCLSDPAAAAPFLSARSWPAQALRDFAIEVIVVDLPPHVREQVQAAQQRQNR